jgi:hypothetical protein
MDSAAPHVGRLDRQPSTVSGLFPCSLYRLIPRGVPERCFDGQSFYSVEDGRRIDLCCGGRRCRHCGPLHWKRRAVARFLSGLVEGESYTMLTLTAPGGDLDVDEWNPGASQRWDRFRSAVTRLCETPARTSARHPFPLRRRSPAFWKVGEFQQRGALHFHGLFRGLPFVPIELVRAAAVRTGFGPRLEWHAPHNLAGLGRYYSKYVLKDVDQWPRGFRVVTYSRDWAVGWKGRSGGSGDWVRVGRGSLAETLLRLPG